jgi:hypothetical protein
MSEWFKDSKGAHGRGTPPSDWRKRTKMFHNASFANLVWPDRPSAVLPVVNSARMVIGISTKPSTDFAPTRRIKFLEIR